MNRNVIAALTALLAAATAAAQSQRAPSGGSPQVRTANGLLAGTTESTDVRVFRGVPFAAPPVRELRWAPPQPARGWKGIRAADRFAAQCIQARLFGDMVFRNDAVSEDCLYLNVWAPAAPAHEPLPVLVYFYGGGFQAGDGSEPRYDGASMARQGMVVVTTSYRLGIFGFFSHPELTSESPHHASGNYALMDQAAALRWVRANVAAFGGDPSRVTIAGESAGSFSVSALMASPLSRDLLAGAIGESGAFFSKTISTPPLADSERRGVEFATGVGARSVGALRSMSAMEVLAAASRPGTPQFGPNVDGWFFPDKPAALYAAGRQAHVPLLAGWNTEEMGARAILRDDPTPESMSKLLTTTFGDQAADAAQVYPSRTNDEALRSATGLAGDQFIAYSTWKWLEEHARTSGKPVYRYLFSRPRPPVTPLGEAILGKSRPATGASHSAEIEYVMGNLKGNRYFAWTDEDYRVSGTAQRYFANFVKTGNPNGNGLPVWPIGSHDATGQAMRMRIDVESRAEPEERARYLFLDRFYAGQRPQD